MCCSQALRPREISMSNTIVRFSPTGRSDEGRTPDEKIAIVEEALEILKRDLTYILRELEKRGE